MLQSISLALLNGLNISLSRSINSSLGTKIGHLKSSLVNHFVGFVVLIPFIWNLARHFDELNVQSVPLYAFFGGSVGAIFVWISNWIIPKIGITRSTMLILSGQMLSGVFFDLLIGKLENPSGAIVGTLLILIGNLIPTLEKTSPKT